MRIRSVLMTTHCLMILVHKVMTFKNCSVGDDNLNTCKNVIIKTELT